MAQQESLDAIRENQVVIIYRGLDAEQCLKISQVLYEAGIRLFEVTMNSPNTPNAIRLLNTELPGDTFIGAGTVRTIAQVESAHQAGASYIISPNTNVDVIKRTKRLHMASIPGAMTPSEVELAYRSGGDMIKIFPINILGPAYVKQLTGPLDDIEFLACGGLKVEMVEGLIHAGCSSIGIGVQLLGDGLVEEENWEVLQSKARDYIQACEFKN